MKPGKWITRTRLIIILGILALAVLGAALALRRAAPAPIARVDRPLTQYPDRSPIGPAYQMTFGGMRKKDLAGKRHCHVRRDIFPAPSRYHS